MTLNRYGFVTPLLMVFMAFAVGRLFPHLERWHQDGW